MLSDSIKAGECCLSISSSDMTTVLHCRQRLALVNVEDRTKSRVLTRVVERTANFSCILAIDHIYEFHLRSGVCLQLNSLKKS